MHLVGVLAVFVLAGCIPAHVPDNLANTPGPPVVIDSDLYRGVVFSAHIPAGWRVITGEAQTAQSVIFVAPDGKTLIRLATGEVLADSLTVASQRNEVRAIALPDAKTVTAAFSSPYSTWEMYYPAFEQVLDSLGSR